MSNYEEIFNTVMIFLNEKIDVTIGEITLNEIQELCDRIDNDVNKKKVNK